MSKFNKIRRTVAKASRQFGGQDVFLRKVKRADYSTASGDATETTRDHCIHGTVVGSFVKQELREPIKDTDVRLSMPDFFMPTGVVPSVGDRVRFDDDEILEIVFSEPLKVGGVTMWHNVAARKGAGLGSSR